MSSNKKIAVIGLGYVGLPLARLFATKYSVTGFDINQSRVDSLQSGTDTTFEVADSVLQKVLLDQSSDSIGLFCTTDSTAIADCTYYIVTVPTPVDKNNRPDLTPLYKSSETVGKVLKKGDIVIYESTVYPGATEEECVPVLEKFSGLQFNVDFFVGYSPERINPGDKEHTVDKILKITSGSTPEIGIQVNELYQSVITAGTHLAPSIKVAEAAKVIENSQRDINIAFVNELAKIFNLMQIDTQAVLAAAGTKWNFLPFKPGLVGGHCIGVDPYYLTHKAEKLGYIPQVILAGRRINDSMGKFIADRAIKQMIHAGACISSCTVTVLGLTFKENCPDLRNSRVIDVIKELREFGIAVQVCEPQADPTEAEEEYGVHLTPMADLAPADAVVVCVAHREFAALDIAGYRALLKPDATVLVDVKGIVDKAAAEAAGLRFWRL